MLEDWDVTVNPAEPCRICAPSILQLRRDDTPGVTRGRLEEGLPVPCQHGASSTWLGRVDVLAAPSRLARARQHRLEQRIALGHGDDARADYHGARARTLEKPGGYVARVERCGTVPAVRIHCRACGESHDVPARCEVATLCASCSKRRSRRYEQRIERALTSALKAERARWNREGRQRMRAPRLVLMTLTCRGTGDLRADRRAIQGAHARLRAWLHVRVGAPPYVRAWETTCGSTGRGHVHAHVATVLPYLDYRALRAEWVRATKGASTGIHVSQGGQRAGRIAGYLAKYVSKGASRCSCDREPGVHALPEAVAAQWVESSAGMRAVTASRRLLPAYEWSCPTCEDTLGAERDATWRDGDWHNRPMCARAPPVR